MNNWFIFGFNFDIFIFFFFILVFIFIITKRFIIVLLMIGFILTSR